MIKKEHFENGTKRIKTKDLNIYEKKRIYWKFLSDLPKNIKEIINLYSQCDNLNLLIDEKNPKFLKGGITKENKIIGKRIKFLPTGIELARGGFSLFAENLKINQKPTKNSWDISYKNTSGTTTYLYSIKKLHLEQESKFKIVSNFKKDFNKIIKNLKNDIIEKEESKYLALYLLLETKIRVGSYNYYLETKHVGLTTLKKKNIKINKKNNTIIFDFIGKDGVPQHIEKKFPDFFLSKFEKLYNSKKINEFLFTNEKNKPIHSEVFSNILFKYTKKHYYPHIIRSYYADLECEKLLKNKKLNKELYTKKLNEIAETLGHKKFDKKKQIWKINHKVTIDSYIYPKLIEKIEKKLDKNKKTKINNNKNNNNKNKKKK